MPHTSNPTTSATRAPSTTPPQGQADSTGEEGVSNMQRGVCMTMLSAVFHWNSSEPLFLLMTAVCGLFNIYSHIYNYNKRNYN